MFFMCKYDDDYGEYDVVKCILMIGLVNFGKLRSNHYDAGF